MATSTFIPGGVHPGAIVLVHRFPFEEDRRQAKSRFAFVSAVNGNAVEVHGIYTHDRAGRVAIRATAENGLHHESFVSPRRVPVRLDQVRPVGETPIDFDPFGDCQ
jgi:hypothetical protein